MKSIKTLLFILFLVSIMALAGCANKEKEPDYIISGEPITKTFSSILVTLSSYESTDIQSYLSSHSEFSEKVRGNNNCVYEQYDIKVLNNPQVFCSLCTEDERNNLLISDNKIKNQNERTIEFELRNVQVEAQKYVATSWINEVGCR